MRTETEINLAGIQIYYRAIYFKTFSFLFFFPEKQENKTDGTH